MTSDRFDEVVKDTLKKVENILVIKGKEYRRNNNPFHNFDVGAKKTGQIREKVLDGMLLKHEISIADITDDLEKGILPTLEIVDEKFIDNINYLILKKASIIDKIEKNLEGKDEENGVNRFSI